MDAEARATATQVASHLLAASKAVGAIAFIVGLGRPSVTLGFIAAGLLLASLGLTFAIDQGFFDGPAPGDTPPTRWDGPPGQGRVTIWDPADFDFSTPAVPGCAPLGITQFGGRWNPLLLGLLLLNATVAAIWWQRERKGRECSRTSSTSAA
jgi:hypothetical protein